jgi:GTP-binding protein
MRFVDEVRLTVESGAGGNGCLSFRREKFLEFGGPDGGDGGAGGSVVFVVDPQLVTLMDLRYRSFLKAADGGNGQGSDCTGAGGHDLVVAVPPGTLIYGADDGEAIADLTAPDHRVVVAHGGAGGRGNAAFKTGRNRAPRRTDPGRPGERRNLRLELKLLADVGLVGFPNVGKSTLISRVSRARPRIAPYPFTTLTPHLGVVEDDDLRRIIIADIPGLIAGAHTGAGLGDRFLRHVERTTVFLFIVAPDPAPDRHPLTDLEVLLNELEMYDAAMLGKRRCLALNKIDTPDGHALIDDVAAEAHRRGMAFFAISAQTGEGVEALVGHLFAMVAEARREPG